MKKTELKPCPFCGCKPKIVQCDDEGNVRGEEYESNPWSGLGYRVVHESDDCPISTGEDGYNLIYDSREEAESHWNTRANECDRDEVERTLENVVERMPEVNDKQVSKSTVANWLRPGKNEWCTIKTKGNKGNKPGILYDPDLEAALAEW